MRLLFFFALAVSVHAAAILEGPREVQVAYDVDVVVTGGSTYAVAAAVSAAKTGASVFLVTDRPYLGEDLCMRVDYRLPVTRQTDPLIKAIWKGKADTTPLAIKRGLDRALLDAEVPFLTGSYPAEVTTDADGGFAGITMVNRSGRHLVKAKVLIDATDQGMMAQQLVAFTKPQRGPTDFAYRVVGGKTVKHADLDSKTLDFGVPMPKNKGSYTVTEYRYRAELKTGSWSEIASIEQRLRTLSRQRDKYRLACRAFSDGNARRFLRAWEVWHLARNVAQGAVAAGERYYLDDHVLAIIFGTAAAGLLGNKFIDESVAPELRAVELWKGSLICVAIAIAGTLTSLWIRRLTPARPKLALELGSLVIPVVTRRLLAADRPLLMALFASCVFWLVSGIAIQAVNSLGLVQLGLDKFGTSVLTASIGLGISIGAVIAGRLSHGRTEFRIVRVGVWGLVLFLGVLSLSDSGGTHLLGFQGSIVVLPLLGVAAGFFAIPIQVFIQDRPPKDQKGRMIAVMNFVNFIAILFSGVLYGLFDRVVEGQGWPRSTIFAMMATIVLPLAIWYRPKNQDALNDGEEDARREIGE